MEAERVYPVLCFGYCLLEPAFFDENGVPQVKANYTTSDVAKGQGWTITDNVKFSYDKSVVWLCPECTKRWQQEKYTRIEDVISCTDKITTEQQFTDALTELRKLQASTECINEFSKKVHSALAEVK